MLKINYFLATIALILPGTIWSDTNTLDLAPPSSSEELSLAAAIIYSVTQPWWLTLGVGIGASEQVPGGLSGDIGLNYEYKPNRLVGIRAADVNNTKIFTVDQWNPASSAGLAQASGHVGGDGDISFIYGVMRHNQYGYLAASTGLGVVFGHKQPTVTNHLGKDFTTLGIPLELQIFWTVSSHIGLGLIGFANANPQGKFAGLTLAVEIGNNLKEDASSLSQTLELL